MSEIITNGNMLNKALREHDTILEEYMKQRFKEWCKENKESVYSNSAMRYWKSKEFREIEEEISNRNTANTTAEE